MSMARGQMQPEENGSPSLPAKSPGYQRYLRELRTRRMTVAGLQILLLLVALILWQVAADHYWVNPMLTSRPTQVWTTLLKVWHNGTLSKHVLTTLRETLAGFGAGMAIGLLVAVALWWWPMLAKVLDPYLVVLNAMPKVALGPILYVWLGEVHSIYGMAVAISVVVTIVMVYVGFREVHPMKLRLMETFGATRLQVLQKVVFPASLPTLMATLKVNIGLTLVGVIMGEFISSKAGLGYLIIYGGQVFQMELVMMSIAILLIISAVMYLAVSWVEQLVTRVFHLQAQR